MENASSRKSSITPSRTSGNKQSHLTIVVARGHPSDRFLGQGGGQWLPSHRGIYGVSLVLVCKTLPSIDHAVGVDNETHVFAVEPSIIFQRVRVVELSLHADP